MPLWVEKQPKDFHHGEERQEQDRLFVPLLNNKSGVEEGKVDDVLL